jgi:hypothetical protein
MIVQGAAKNSGWTLRNRYRTKPNPLGSYPSFQTSCDCSMVRITLQHILPKSNFFQFFTDCSDMYFSTMFPRMDKNDREAVSKRWQTLFALARKSKASKWKSDSGEAVVTTD